MIPPAPCVYWWLPCSPAVLGRGVVGKVLDKIQPLCEYCQQMR
jgi:hypothetical protein